MDKRQKQIRRNVNIRKNNVPKSEKRNVETTPSWTMQAPKLPNHWKGHADPNHDVVVRKVSSNVVDGETRIKAALEMFTEENGGIPVEKSMVGRTQ